MVKFFTLLQTALNALHLFHHFATQHLYYQKMILQCAAAHMYISTSPEMTTAFMLFQRVKSKIFVY